MSLWQSDVKLMVLNTSVHNYLVIQSLKSLAKCLGPFLDLSVTIKDTAGKYIIIARCGGCFGENMSEHVMFQFGQPHIQPCKKVFAPFLISYFYVCLSHVRVSDHQTNFNIGHGWHKLT